MLQLILKKLGNDEEFRIDLELNKEELETFISKLKKVQVSLKNTKGDNNNM
jgi:hypothetical protein